MEIKNNSQRDFFTMHQAVSEEDMIAIQTSMINRSFGWMTIGLGVSGLIAGYLGTNQQLLFSLGKFIWFLVLLEFGVVFMLTAAINRISSAAATMGFLFYALLNGVTLSCVFLVYEIGSVVSCFFSTAATFGAMSLYGWATKRDLTGLGSLCFMGLVGLIIASLFGIFFPFSHGFSLFFNIIAVIIFVGLTAYDVQKLKQLSINLMTDDPEAVGKLGIIGALTLYLDFVNLFLHILRLFGRRK